MSSKRVGQATKARGAEPKMKMKRIRVPWDKEQLDWFWFWVNERHRIYLARQNNKPWPWTKDVILQEYKFTNCFRQLDRVTQEWTKRYAGLIGRKLKPHDILFQCALFRLFNWPPTYDALRFELGDTWSLKRACSVLKARQDSGDDTKKQLFTGAYIIPSGGSTDPKYETICRALDWLYKHREDFAARILKKPSMELTTNLLQNIFTVGPFIAYEIACDLRFTKVLADATDTMSWANPGPGAKRGIHRLLSGSADWSGARPAYIPHMRELLLLAPQHLQAHVKNFKEWPFEMREIEHSLCEFDKMQRVRYGEGKPRSRYTPVLQGQLALEHQTPAAKGRKVVCCQCEERTKWNDNHCSGCNHKLCKNCRVIVAET